jgi:uroporphyrinogen decarboxylase
MTSTMTHWERLQAAIQGDEVDHLPISLWRHWPVEDETPQGLAAATIRWQHEYEFDLVKFMPTGTYGMEDWGAKTTRGSGPVGTRVVAKFAVTSADAWPRLAQLDVTQGDLGRHIEAIRLAADGLRNGVPILQTVFSPLTTAYKLAGERVYADLRRHPERLEEGLQIIADTTARFALASIRAGAHGVFFATQSSTYRLLNEAEYRQFGMPYDLMVLNAVRAETDLNMLHVHGEDIMFNLMADYPVQMLNWHDRITWPSLADASSRFDGLLVGGIREFRTLRKGPVSAIQAEVHDAMVQTDGRRLMLGAGCVIPTDIPATHVCAAVQAVMS